MSQEIELINLSVGYTNGKHSHTVASCLNAIAHQSKLTCLIGRNGMGKSTLLRTIARLQPQTSGNVMIDGKDVKSYSADQFACTVALVLTGRPSTTNMTVEELVGLGRTPYTGFWGRLTGEDRQIVNNAMKVIGISDMAKRKAASLSDGEMQKVMIAKALAQDTPIIILDEPTAFLDFPAKIDLLLQLHHLAHDKGKTILLSTHDIESTLQIADYLWIMSTNGIATETPLSAVENGSLKQYIGRHDVAIDKDSMGIRIKKTE